MRKVVVVLALGAMLVPVLPAGAADADGIVGFWLTAPGENGQAKIEIVENEGRYGGAIVWLEKPTYPADDDQGMGGQERVDRENPEENLRDRPILGLQLVDKFRFAGDNRWENGIIYDPNNGKTYKCKAALSADGATLKVRGYIGFSLLGRTEVWTRVIPED